MFLLPPDPEPSVILGASSIGCGPSRILKRSGDAPEDVVSDLPPCVRMHGYVQGEELCISYP